ncbi:MAG: thrombospondin type 3 repeat-containing protein [Planctomycetota bacterium]
MKVWSLCAVTVCATLLSFTKLGVAVITVECIPPDGAIVSAGDIVEVECFISSDMDQRLYAGKLDLACSLPSLGVAEGAITSTTLFTFVQSSDGIPVLFFAGLHPVNPFLCLLSGSPCGICPPEFLDANEVRYMGTILYEVSECAAGDFEITLENYDTPPVLQDLTRFLDRAEGHFVPIQVAYQPTVLTVEVGACCMADSTCEMLNAICCESQGGVPQSAGTMCDSDADGICDSADNCPAIANANQADSDGDTVGDACDLCPGQDDLLDADNNFVPDCRQNIPTVSTWGMVILTLCLMTLGKIGGWVKLKRRVDGANYDPS